MDGIKISSNGLDGTNFFHKIPPNWYHKIRARWFFHIFEATFFLQHKWEGVLTRSSSSLLILVPFFQERPTLERSCIIALWGCGNVHLAGSCVIYEGGVMFTYPALWGSDVHRIIQRGETLSKAMKHSKKVIWRVPYVIQYSNICPSKGEGSYAYYLRAGGTLHLWAYTYYLGMGVTLCRFISIRSR